MHIIYFIYMQVLPFIVIMGGIVSIGLFPNGLVIGCGLAGIGILVMLVIYEIII